MSLTRARQKISFELSGGMARRVLVSTAAATQAKVIIADEPTPDSHPRSRRAPCPASVRLRTRARRYSSSRTTSTLPCAMPTRYPCSTPEPRLRRQRPRISAGRSFCAIPTARRCGARCRRINLSLFPELQPYAGNLPSGCVFSDRCPLRTEACDMRPEFRTVRGGEVRCHHAD